MFYNNDIYFTWRKDCEAAGIEAIFIPGLMPIFGYDRFIKTVKFCKSNIPDFLTADLAPIKDNEDKVREYGVKFGIRQAKELIEGGSRYLHFYTMNLEASVIKIVKGLGILDKHRNLPFIKGTEQKRQDEDVRPIFWANKPASYL